MASAEGPYLSDCLPCCQPPSCPSPWCCYIYPPVSPPPPYPFSSWLTSVHCYSCGPSLHGAFCLSYGSKGYFLVAGVTWVQFILAQVGASLCWQWNARNGHSLCSKVEQHNADGLGRGGEEGRGESKGPPESMGNNMKGKLWWAWDDPDGQSAVRQLS